GVVNEEVHGPPVGGAVTNRAPSRPGAPDYLPQAAASGRYQPSRRSIPATPVRRPTTNGTTREGTTMAHPVIHAEIRAADPDATRAFFADLFGWTYSEGAFPGYTFVDTRVEGALPTAIGPLQGGSDAVLFFVGVEDVEE